jgi:methylmalonyl-CoA/ethylmalonyl-CoA epimerase
MRGSRNQGTFSIDPTGMDIMKINHIAIVVKNIEKDMKVFVEDYGYEQISDILTIDNQQVRVVLLNCGNDMNIELIEPVGEDSPVSNALKKGGGLNHICYETKEFDRLYEKFKNKVVRSPRPAPQEYFNGGRTFFAYRRGGLVEFLEVWD